MYMQRDRIEGMTAQITNIIRAKNIHAVLKKGIAMPIKTALLINTLYKRHVLNSKNNFWK